MSEDRLGTTIFAIEMARGTGSPGPWCLLVETVVVAALGVACG